MDKFQQIAIIVLICVIVLLIGVVRNRAELLINFALRTVTGLAAIYIVNELLQTQNVALQVGINPITILTSGMLGIPGVAMLYGIVGCNFL